MNKSDIIAHVAPSAGQSKAATEKVLDLFLTRIKQGLWKGERVILSGFGTFHVRERKARQVLNPQTRQPLMIRARNVVRFRPGSELLRAVGGKR
jgi:DNA-binding protein HU-beta